MIQNLGQKAARRIKRVVPDHPASLDVLAFSLTALLNVLAIVTITLIIAIFTGKIASASIAIVSFAILRQLSGGIHLPSTDWCVVVSVIGLTALSFLDGLASGITITATIVSMIIAALFAPTGIERQSRIPKRFYPYLKVVSVALIASNLLIGSSVIAFSFLAQCLTLTKKR
ncbi:accessory gene regulator B family protein [Cohnella sp. LGH]|uniref:accessory gene regulator ArgB-like protein n=1 Tax=Cohnella sp. LGH TaxID=1619153 RepID=UPI001ADBD441|nr:accessory gene regulator B family protein [Cohnella sp. LGH]QTH44987.1 accessory gene regulator B family protein [Cohnella sp. LGH]